MPTRADLSRLNPATRGRRRALALLLAGSAALAGCASPRAGAAPEPVGDRSIRYTQGGTSLSFANVLYARHAQKFEGAGLKVDYLPAAQSSSQTINLLVTGQADVVVVSPSAVLGALGSKRSVKSFAVTTVGASTGIALHKDAVARLAAKGVTPTSPIKERIAALKGLRLAGVGATTSQYQMALSVLGHGGLGEKDVQMLTTPDHEASAASARQGQSDGYIAAVPQRLLAESEGWGTTWVAFSDIKELGLDTVPYMELVSTPAFAKANPEVIQKFVTALEETEKDFETKPADVANVLKTKSFPDMNPQLFQSSFDTVVPYFTAGLEPQEAGFKSALDQYNATGDQKVDLSFDDVYDLQFLQK